MEDYVTFEQALRLKELGFDWKVRACYRRKFILDDDNPHYTEPKFVHNDTMGKRWTTNYNDNRCCGGTSKRYCSAPTLSQAQKWLREVKEIIICIEPSFYRNKRPLFGYDYHLFNKDEGWNSHIESETVYDSYEQALSAGIDKALELLK